MLATDALDLPSLHKTFEDSHRSLRLRVLRLVGVAAAARHHIETTSSTFRDLGSREHVSRNKNLITAFFSDRPADTICYGQLIPLSLSFSQDRG
jgi:hypothetical protein